MLNIYLVSRPYGGYDTYDAFVVCAGSEQDARDTHPRGVDGRLDWDSYGWLEWEDRNSLEVKLLGTANIFQEPGVVLSSFNAG